MTTPNTENTLDAVMFGAPRVVTVDKYDVRAAACAYRSIATDAYRGHDESRAILNMALFVRCVKMVGLEPRHIVQWLVKQGGGLEAMADCVSQSQPKSQPRWGL